MTSSAVWTPDWPQTVLAKVHALGYPSVTAFLSAQPGESYVAVARRLGGVAAVQLGKMQLAEIKDGSDLRRAAMDCLSREVAPNFPKGWGIHSGIPEVPDDGIWKHLSSRGLLKDDEIPDRIAFQTSGVYANWVGFLIGYDESARKRADAVWAALVDSSPPPGWLPSGPDDPIIVAAFDKGWPVQSRKRIRRQSYGLLCPNCTAVLTTPPDQVSLINCPHCGEEIELI